MEFYLKKAIFVNRAPFERLELNFKEKGINVLAAINGRGKTTILSHITDSFYELARSSFSNEFKGIENQYYRYSSPIDVLKAQESSLVYFRFKNGFKTWDYIDIRNNCTQEQFNELCKESSITYDEIKDTLANAGNIKKWSNNTEDEIISVFENNLITYFPAYRYEEPGYLNDPYKIELSFKKHLALSGYLPNNIEVVSDLRVLANWLMDLVLDDQLYQSKESYQLKTSFNHILSKTLSSKIIGDCRIGIAPRNSAGTRISVVQDKANNIIDMIYPTIFNISSGEAAMLCLFGELLHQADKIGKLLDASGIVLIDEVDKHLHIKLQKEILPKLFNLFPNIQFIISSHSPFLNMGLADEALERTQIFDLDNNGIVCSPKNNALYTEVYDLMVNENERYAEKYREIISKINTADKPIIITEGKTDYKHIQNAIHALGITDVDVDFYDVPDDWGDSKLRTMLENISRIKQHRIVIGIFDRDDPQYIEYVTENNQYRSFGDSNVYAFAIPLVNEDIYGDQISIEHYYKKENLLKSDTNGRRLFLGKEFYDSGNSINGEYQTKISKIQHKVKINGIIDDKVYESNDLQQSKNIALSKSAFVELIISDSEYNKDFDFSSFNHIIDIIKSIISNPIK